MKYFTRISTEFHKIDAKEDTAYEELAVSYCRGRGLEPVPDDDGELFDRFHHMSQAKRVAVILAGMKTLYPNTDPNDHAEYDRACSEEIDRAIQSRG